MPLSWFFTLSFLFLFIHALPFIAQGVVPPSHSFTHVNEGEFGDYVVEYNANCRALRVSTSPFQLCFYNTTPDVYTIALRWERFGPSHECVGFGKQTAGFPSVKARRSRSAPTGILSWRMPMVVSFGNRTRWPKGS
ncbi:hypothetical protein OROGR_015291 [Orobanche gracilis]